MIDKRTLEKYEKDAKEAGRNTWYLSWALDTNAEERAKVKEKNLPRPLPLIRLDTIHTKHLSSFFAN